MKRFFRLLSIVIILSIGFAAWLAASGLSAKPSAADVAIVFGNKVNPDGRPSARLAARLGTARRLYEQRLVGHVIVSGGFGKEGFDEAAVMKRYLAAAGVPDTAILVDSQGLNTTRTARNAGMLMRERGWATADLVTQYFHVARARWACRREGIRVVGAQAPRFFEPRDLYSLAREVIALPVYVMKGEE